MPNEMSASETVRQIARRGTACDAVEASLRRIAAREPEVQALKAQPRDGDCNWVFPADRGEGHFVGVPKVLERVSAHADLVGVTVHSLRHTYASVAAEMGYSELTIAGLLGHTVPGVTARYAHVPDRALVSAADAVSARIVAALDGDIRGEVLLMRSV
jgi:integrase